jgi:hypothetical protein
MKLLVYFCLFLGFLPLLFSNKDDQATEKLTEFGVSSEKEYQTKYHIILVLDGPRWKETYGDTSYKYIPNLGKKLKQQGTLFTDFRNSGSTYTNAGHTAITTGIHQRISNQGKELPKNPSIFQYLLKEKQLDKRKAWILASKGKLEILGNTKDRKWWNQYIPSTFCGWKGSGVGYPPDRINWQTYKDIITEHQPVLTLINLLDIDVWGHQNNWERYIAAHLELDSLSLDLWKMIQANPDMKDKTALYITNDHGRHLDGHKDGFKSHGDGCEGCRHISLLAIGPDFEKNKIVSARYDQIDLTASISYLLGFYMPTSKGCPIPELVAPNITK